MNWEEKYKELVDAVYVVGNSSRDEMDLVNESAPDIVDITPEQAAEQIVIAAAQIRKMREESNVTN
jgi:hypothetical protein